MSLKVAPENVPALTVLTRRCNDADDQVEHFGDCIREGNSKWKDSGYPNCKNWSSSVRQQLSKRLAARTRSSCTSEMLIGRFPAYHFGISSAILVFFVFFVFSSGFGLYCSYQVTYLQIGIIAIN